MQKQEFEERIERTVTDEQYKVIEEVYMWHPSIRNTSGKDEVAELYKSFGMTIFHDMLPRAKKAHELDELLRNAQREVQRIQEEIEELSCPTLRVEEMRQWHQGKEGFMKVTRIQDKYNPDKVWMIKRYLCGTFYVNQEIKGQKFYDRDRRMTKRMLVSIGVLA